VIPGVRATLEGPTPGHYYEGDTNEDGYLLLQRVVASLGASHLTLSKPGYVDVSVHVDLVTLPQVENQAIRVGSKPKTATDIVLPALERAIPAPLPFTPFRGGFCIAGALPGIPFGDGRRIWTPAFGCYQGVHAIWQDRMLEAGLQRGHTWFEIQVSGRPYGSDYPELDLDITRIVHDLVKIRRAGGRSIIAFRDDLGPDCSYLKEVAAETQELVDAVMGIYESNGVFAETDGSYSARTYAQVESVLRQQRALWPGAINAFHSTAQNNGTRGFGEQDFWARMQGIVDVYFLQQTAWTQPLADVSDRAQDFTERLMGGKAGWPVLPYGVVMFEEVTSKTYRGMSEAEGAAIVDALMEWPLKSGEARRCTGYMDNGTVHV
jgi:hypothetical protein